MRLFQYIGEKYYRSQGLSYLNDVSAHYNSLVPIFAVFLALFLGLFYSNFHNLYYFHWFLQSQVPIYYYQNKSYRPYFYRLIEVLIGLVYIAYWAECRGQNWGDNQVG